MIPAFDYVGDAESIIQLSRSRMRDCLSLPKDAPHDLLERLVYATADPDILPHLRWHDDFMASARDALQSSSPILTDSMMTLAGIQKHRLPANNKTLCFLEAISPQEAQMQKKTRSSLAVDHWQTHLEGSLVAIGNAPTALYRLMELLRNGAAPPAAIAAFPLGFVGAEEAKQIFLAHYDYIPFVTLIGKRGGSALAAAAINAAIVNASNDASNDTSIG